MFKKELDCVRRGREVRLRLGNESEILDFPLHFSRLAHFTYVKLGCGSEVQMIKQSFLFVLLSPCTNFVGVMIELHGIKKSFGALEVLKGIDLSIDKEEVVSIVGPSGAGKTTLLQIMGTLYKPDA